MDRLSVDDVRANQLSVEQIQRQNAKRQIDQLATMPINAQPTSTTQPLFASSAFNAAVNYSDQPRSTMNKSSVNLKTIAPKPSNVSIEQQQREIAALKHQVQALTTELVETHGKLRALAELESKIKRPNSPVTK